MSRPRYKFHDRVLWGSFLSKTADIHPTIHRWYDNIHIVTTDLCVGVYGHYPEICWCGPQLSSRYDVTNLYSSKQHISPHWLLRRHHYRLRVCRFIVFCDRIVILIYCRVPFRASIICCVWMSFFIHCFLFDGLCPRFCAIKASLVAYFFPDTSP